MQSPAALKTLKEFRLAAYQTLGLRKDSLFELMEAVLAAPGPATIVRLSLAAVFRRAWPSAPDALADGAVDGDRCRELIQTTAIEPGAGGRPVWALDGTIWPRPAAGTSPERTVWASHHAGHPARRRGCGLGVRMAGRCAGAGHGVDATVGYPSSWAERGDTNGGGGRDAAGGPGTAAGGGAAPGVCPRQWL